MVFVGETPLVLEPTVTNISSIRGMPRSGRVFSLEQPPKKNILGSSMGKEAIILEEAPSKKTLPQEETEEFLRLVKKSDYKVVD